MGRTAGRSGHRTRQLLLDAAAQQVKQRGMTASLDDIAETAGVSKGAVLYHFKSKETLLAALAQYRLDLFRETILEHVAPTDQTPGRFTRAYIQAALDQDPGAIWEDIQLFTQLTLDPAIDALLEEFGVWLNTQFSQDGLPSDVSSLIVYAAEGASYSMLWGEHPDPKQHNRLQTRLIAMTHDPEWLNTLPLEQEGSA